MAGLTQQLLGRLPLIAMAGAVGAVLADVQLLAHLGRQRVGVGRGRHAHVEGRVEHGDVRELGVGLAAVLDDAGLGIVVQRGERGDLVDLGENLIVDERGVLEVPAALNDAVAEGLHLEAVLVDELDDLADGSAVIGEVHDLLDLLAITLDMAEDAVGQTDALAIALGEDLAGLGVHQLEFEARATGVENENVHDTPWWFGCPVDPGSFYTYVSIIA